MIRFLFWRKPDPLRQLARMENARAVMATWTSTPVESDNPEPSRRFFRSRKAS